MQNITCFVVAYFLAKYKFFKNDLNLPMFAWFFLIKRVIKLIELNSQTIYNLIILNRWSRRNKAAGGASTGQFGSVWYARGRWSNHLGHGISWILADGLYSQQTPTTVTTSPQHKDSAPFRNSESSRCQVLDPPGQENNAQNRRCCNCKKATAYCFINLTEIFLCLWWINQRITMEIMHFACPPIIQSFGAHRPCCHLPDSARASPLNPIQNRQQPKTASPLI